MHRFTIKGEPGFKTKKMYFHKFLYLPIPQEVKKKKSNRAFGQCGIVFLTIKLLKGVP